MQWTEVHEGRAWRGAGPTYEWSIIKLDEEPGPDKYPYLLTRWGNPQSDDPINMTQVTGPRWGMDIAEAIERGAEGFDCFLHDPPTGEHPLGCRCRSKKCQKRQLRDK